eukprot:scaffold2.g6821.t1
MASVATLLEETRQLHEDLERLERLIVKAHKDKLVQSHRVRRMLDQAQERAARLVTIYADEDGARREEIAALRGDNVFGNFYDRLKEVRDFHRRFPDDAITEVRGQAGGWAGPLAVAARWRQLLLVTRPPPTLTRARGRPFPPPLSRQGDGNEALLGPEPTLAFSGEEGLGRYLDLHELHRQYVNAKFGKEVDYYTYVSSLADFSGVARAQRLGRPYAAYLSALLSYLESLYRRTQPLAQLGRQMKKAEEEFEARWAAGEVPGWEDLGAGGAASGEAGGEALDLDAFESAQELEELGPERLKAALQAMGLKCGGTLAQRAQRLWATKGKSLAELDKSLFAKGAGPAHNGSADAAGGCTTAAPNAALLEAKVAKLVEMLGSVVEDTKGRIEKRQAQTYEEMLAEQQEAEEEVAVEESDEEEYIYNPLKLPLGWDGKPIPYWLYKLHGLNIEFKCEICGNATYWGRRAFERHFKEWRHQNGMKALGIPNSKQFFEARRLASAVTTIADALSLWKNLQEREKGGFKAEQDEEFEDDQGRVYSKKTYEDLRRQGLV